jgi:sugar phosphate isomerase/epimerase
MAGVPLQPQRPERRWASPSCDGIRTDGGGVTDYSLAHLTVLSLPPPQLVRLAARIGYRTVGLRLLRVTDTSPGYPLMDDPAMMRETRAAIAETGVGVLDIEFVQLRPETDVNALRPLLEAGGALGARYLVAAPYDPDLVRLADRFAALCDVAASCGMGVVLEFFPWTTVPGVAEANAIVSAAGRQNGGVLVDTLHFDRGPSTLAQLDAVPPSSLPYIHVCDAPGGTNWTLEQLLYAARVERLPPGEGDIRIADVLAHMPAGIPVALEVPMTALTAESGPEEVARRVYHAARRLIG